MINNKSKIIKNKVLIKGYKNYNLHLNYSRVYNPLINFKIPDFINFQRQGFQHFLKIGLIKEFKKLKKITNSNKNIEIVFHIEKYKVLPPELTIKQAIYKKQNYSCQLFVPVEIINHNTKESIIDWFLLMNLPLMTNNGHFIINGSPKIIINQIIRSPGIYFKKNVSINKTIFYSADFIAQRGTWLRLEIDNKKHENQIWAKMKGIPKIPIASFLRCLGISLPIFNNYLNLYKLNLNSFTKQKNDLIIGYRNEEYNDKDNLLLMNNEISKFNEFFKKLDINNNFDNFFNNIYTNINNNIDKSFDELMETISLESELNELKDNTFSGKEFLYEKFLNPRLYNLSKVGRLNINRKLGINVPEDYTVLTAKDILFSCFYLLRCLKGIQIPTDFDNLKNRYVRSSGTLIQIQVGLGILQLENSIHERLMLDDKVNQLSNLIFEYNKLKTGSFITKNIKNYSRLVSNQVQKNSNLKIKSPDYNKSIKKKTSVLNTQLKFNLGGIINSKIFNNLINTFFNTNPLVQFLDQINPLAEITHKRRLSKLGEDGVTTDSATMDMRGIHESHYGRTCPIETPEGKNAGLVNSFTIYSHLNLKGFIETPFYQVYKGFVLMNKGLFLFSSQQEKNLYIAPGDIKKNKLHFLSNKKNIPCRKFTTFTKVPRVQINYIAINPIQMISIATSLIPFIEHNDGNRALMGSNMQRQSLPLIKPQFPIVGTGLESNVIANIHYGIQAKSGGLVIYVDGKEISIISSKKKIVNPVVYYPIKSFNKLFNTKFTPLKKDFTTNSNTILMNKHNEFNLFGFNKFIYLNISVKKNYLFDKETFKLNNFSLSNSKFIYTIFNLNCQNSINSIFEIINVYSQKTTYSNLKIQFFLSRNNLFLLKNFKSRNNIINYSYFILQNSPLMSYLIANLFQLSNFNKNKIQPKKMLLPIYFNILLNKINLSKQFYLKNYTINKYTINNEKVKFNFSKKITKRNTFGHNLDKLLLLNLLTETTLIDKFLNISKKTIIQSSYLTNSHYFNLKYNLNYSYSFKSNYNYNTIFNFRLVKKQINKKKIEKIKVNYKCDPFSRSNQNTYLVHKPIIKKGQWVESGDILADNGTSYKGELSIGQNLLVGYLPWEGYNFEDAVLINKNLVSNDIFTSLHIERYQTELKETEFGQEEFTPLLNDNSKPVEYLNDTGIIKLGTWVKEGDILVGKITPTAPRKLSPYQSLLYDIMEKPLPQTKNTSLRVPLNITGRVVNIELIETNNDEDINTEINIPSNLQPILPTTKKTNLSQQNKTLKTKKFFIYKYLKMNNSFEKTFSNTNINFTKYKLEEFNFLVKYKLIEKPKSITQYFYLKNFYNYYYKLKKNIGNKLYTSMNIKKFLLKEEKIKKYKKRKKILLFPFFNLLKEILDNKIKHLKIFHNSHILMNLKTNDFINNNIYILFKTKHPTFFITSLYNFIFKIGLKKINFNSKTNLKLKTNKIDIKKIKKVYVYIAEQRPLQLGDKISGRHGNKGIISNILPSQDMPFLPDGTPLDLVLNPLGVPSRMNVGQIFECLLGLAGTYLNQCYKIQLFDETYGCQASTSLVYSKLYEASIKTNYKWLFNGDYPGKIQLFDGRTGDSFEQLSTIGKTYILKLIHQVDEKIHARCIGPYSLVTQQPVKGRAKNGGQRVGEMEVWALEGFGASYILQELLTIKSDDIRGRNKLPKCILENKVFDCGIPESFEVLIRELKSLCLDICINK